ncbi:hypothetical protein CB1_000611003 [Camelus ferus]|nr:hypothetical protein CB1_000611003 [Camelus ferus]
MRTAQNRQAFHQQHGTHAWKSVDELELQGFMGAPHAAAFVSDSCIPATRLRSSARHSVPHPDLGEHSTLRSLKQRIFDWVPQPPTPAQRGRPGNSRLPQGHPEDG